MNNKEKHEAVVRLVAMIIAGFLIYGWRGAVALVLFMFVVKGLVADHVEAMVAISKIQHK